MEARTSQITQVLLQDQQEEDGVHIDPFLFRDAEDEVQASLWWHVDLALREGRSCDSRQSLGLR